MIYKALYSKGLRGEKSSLQVVYKSLFSVIEINVNILIASNDINKGRDYESSSTFNASICLNTLNFYHFFNNGVWSSKIHQKSPKKCRHSALDS